MAANIQAYLENLRQPWGQIYYDILFEQLQDIKGSECLILAVVLALWPTTWRLNNEVLLWAPMKRNGGLAAPGPSPTQQLAGVWTR